MKDQFKELLKYGKAWAAVQIATQAATVVALLVMTASAAVALHGGGTLMISWQPGG